SKMSVPCVKCDSSIDGFVPCEDFPILDASYAPEIDAPDKNNLCENKFNLFLNKYDSTKANTRFKEVLLAELRNIYMSHDNPKTDPCMGSVRNYSIDYHLIIGLSRNG